MNKKLISLLLAGSMLLSAGVAFAEKDSTDEVVTVVTETTTVKIPFTNFYGTIKKINKDNIVVNVIGDDGKADITFETAEEFITVDADGEETTAKVGDNVIVSAFVDESEADVRQVMAITVVGDDNDTLVYPGYFTKKDDKTLVSADEHVTLSTDDADKYVDKAVLALYTVDEDDKCVVKSILFINQAGSDEEATEAPKTSEVPTATAAPKTISDRIAVLLNGSEISFDVDPLIINDRTMVPFRKIFEALGCSVDYNVTDGKQVVTASNGEVSLTLTIGESVMLSNGTEIKLDSAPVIKNDRTLVPLRAISEALKANVDWDDTTRTVIISTISPSVAPTKEPLVNTQKYVINTQTKESTVTDDNGTVLMKVTSKYPSFEDADNGGYLSDVNQYYADKVTSFEEKAEKDYKDLALEQLAERKTAFEPMTFELTFDNSYNTSNYVSITTTEYVNANGPSPSYYLESRTYDMKNQKLLTLDDIFNLSSASTLQTLKQYFSDYARENPDMFESTTATELLAKVNDINFYLNETGVVMYFNRGEIAPNAAGIPAITIPYSGNSKAFKIDFTK